MDRILELSTGLTPGLMDCKKQFNNNNNSS